MGISIIISHKEDGVLNTDYFVAQLKRKWSEVKIHFIAEPNAHLLQFNNDDNFWLLGDFSGTGVIYKANGRKEDAQFALWYRSIVPSTWKLVVYDSALTFDLMLLTNETTEEEFIAGCNIPFDADKYK